MVASMGIIGLENHASLDRVEGSIPLPSVKLFFT